MIDLYETFNYHIDKKLKSDFVKNNSKALVNFYENNGFKCNSPVTKDNNVSLIINRKNKQLGTIASIKSSDNFMAYYHLEEPMIIQTRIVKNNDSNFYTKITTVRNQDPNNNDCYSYELKVLEVFDLNGNKIFEESMKRSNKNGVYKNSDEKFDSTQKRISAIQYDAESNTYKMIHLINVNGDESLLSIPVGESENPSLQPIKIERPNLNENDTENITNFELSFNSHAMELSDYLIIDTEIPEKLKNQASFYYASYINTEKELSLESIKHR